MSGATPIVAVPNQDEITVADSGDYVSIHQTDGSGNGEHSEVLVHRSNLSHLIDALLRIADQER